MENDNIEGEIKFRYPGIQKKKKKKERGWDLHDVNLTARQQQTAKN